MLRRSTEFEILSNKILNNVSYRLEGGLKDKSIGSYVYYLPSLENTDKN